MVKDNAQMVQVLRERVGLSEDDAERTVEVIDEVFADDQPQQPEPHQPPFGEFFKDAVVTERTGYLTTPAIFARLARLGRRKRRQPSATV
ncbi:MAG: hypothetical protein ACHQC8_06165 [Solirubrobacterales bacterium]